MVGQFRLIGQGPFFGCGSGGVRARLPSPPSASDPFHMRNSNAGVVCYRSVTLRYPPHGHTRLRCRFDPRASAKYIRAIVLPLVPHGLRKSLLAACGILATVRSWLACPCTVFSRKWFWYRHLTAACRACEPVVRDLLKSPATAVDVSCRIRSAEPRRVSKQLSEVPPFRPARRPRGRSATTRISRERQPSCRRRVWSVW